jgi:hypothetical protein
MQQGSGGVTDDDGWGGAHGVDTDTGGASNLGCDAGEPSENPWLLPNVDAARRSVWGAEAGQCAPGFEVDKWDGYFNEYFLECKDTPLPAPETSSVLDAELTARSFVLQATVEPGETLSLSTEIASARDVRLELWGTCGPCAQPVELLGMTSVAASSTAVPVCFEVQPSGAHSHLLLLMSGSDAAHGHVRFCPGATCASGP